MSRQSKHLLHGARHGCSRGLQGRLLPRADRLRELHRDVERLEAELHETESADGRMMLGFVRGDIARNDAPQTAAPRRPIAARSRGRRPAGRPRARTTSSRSTGPPDDDPGESEPHLAGASAQQQAR